MTIIIECSPRDMYALFESPTISSGMTKDIPGAATIRLATMGMERKSLPSIQAALIPIELKWAGDVVSQVAIGLVTTWICDKLKGNRTERRVIRIQREMTEVTPENLTRIFKESVEIEEHKR